MTFNMSSLALTAPADIVGPTRAECVPAPSNEIVAKGALPDCLSGMLLDEMEGEGTGGEDGRADAGAAPVGCGQPTESAERSQHMFRRLATVATAELTAMLDALPSSEGFLGRGVPMPPRPPEGMHP